MSNEKLKEIKRIATDFRKGMLGKNNSNEKCLMVSASLEGYLRFCGYECELTEGIVGDWFHFWITFHDATVLDPTADQFKSPDGNTMPAIYIGEKPKWYEVIKQGVN